MKSSIYFFVAMMLFYGFSWAGEEPPTPASNKALIDLVQSHADYIWTLIAAALVFFMQAGFAMVETGFTRAKNAINIIWTFVRPPPDWCRTARIDPDDCSFILLTTYRVNFKKILKQLNPERRFFDMKKCTVMTLAALLLFSIFPLNGPAWGQGEQKGVLDPENFSATLTFTSDYVFRGVSQTDEEPAIQGSFDYSHPVGLYLGMWGSNVDEAISDANLEIDLYVGYRRELLKDFNLDLTGYYYAYPGNEKDPDPEFIELHLCLSYAFSEMKLSPTIGIGYNYSPDFFGEDGAAHYINVTGALALPYGFNVYAEVGYQTVEGDKLTGNGQGQDGGDGFDYTHWKIGVSKEVVGFKLDAAFHSTGDEEFLGEIGENRLVFTISRSF